MVKITLLIYVLILFVFVYPFIMIIRGIRTDQSASTLLVQSIFKQLLLCLLVYVLATSYFDQSLIQWIEKEVRYQLSIMSQVPELSKVFSVEQLEKLYLEQIIPMLKVIFPALFVFMNAMLVTITYAIVVPLARAIGVTSKRLMPIKEWRLPRKIAWLYLIVFVLQLVMVADPESLPFVIVANLSIGISVALAVQGASALFFVVEQIRGPKAIAVVVTFVLSFFAQVLSFIGLFDLLFPIRDAIKRKS